MIIFDDTIADMLSNKKLQQIIAELFKVRISLAFTTQSYFAVPKNIALNSNKQTRGSINPI